MTLFEGNEWTLRPRNPGTNEEHYETRSRARLMGDLLRQLKGEPLKVGEIMGWQALLELPQFVRNDFADGCVGKCRDCGSTHGAHRIDCPQRKAACELGVCR